MATVPAEPPQNLFYCEIEERYDTDTFKSKKILVESCWDNCTSSYKEKDWNKYIADPGTHRCLQPSVTTCQEMNLVYCPGGDTLPYGACVPSCKDCYITVNDIDTSGGVIYEPQFINDENTDTCISEETAKHNCFDNGKHWCGALGKCINNCNSCIDTETNEIFKLNAIAGSGYEC
jgi:hypothetical protein